eukprot:312371_1
MEDFKQKEDEPLLALNNEDTQENRSKSGEIMKLLRNTIIPFVFLFPAIIAVIVAATSDYSSCITNDTVYTIDLDVWLYVLGIMPIIVRVFWTILDIYSLFNESFLLILNRYRTNNMKSILQCNICTLLFYIIWISIGLYVYSNQMPHECKVSVIGQTIIGVSIVLLVVYCGQMIGSGFLWCGFFLGIASVVNTA